MSPDSRPDRPDPLFQHLVLLFSSAAMQHLGKLVNPATGKADVDLQGAQSAIDMLALLESRTRGNLHKDESRALQDALLSLRLNYVEVAQPTATPSDTAAAPEENATPSGADEKKADSDDSLRYHKSYG
jgi:hypothetical protein